MADIYISENQLDAALDLYKTITASDQKASWAWKRLGFYELVKSGNLDNAGTSPPLFKRCSYDSLFTLYLGKCFQTALRVETGDHACWEGLGECYKFQGKYVASLKAFSKAAEIFPGSVNAQLQMATIKQKLGMTEEAICKEKDCHHPKRQERHNRID